MLFFYSTDCRNCILLDLNNEYSEEINNYYLKLQQIAYNIFLILDFSQIQVTRHFTLNESMPEYTQYYRNYGMC